MQWYSPAGLLLWLPSRTLTVINLTVVQQSKYGWRAIYFFGAGFSLLAAIVRACLPESRQFIVAREEAKAKGISSKQASKNFIRELGNMFRTNCKIFQENWREGSDSSRQGFDGYGLSAL